MGSHLLGIGSQCLAVSLDKVGLLLAGLPDEVCFNLTGCGASLMALESVDSNYLVGATRGAGAANVGMMQWAASVCE
jgi:hypothetical protein